MILPMYNYIDMQPLIQQYLKIDVHLNNDMNL